METVYSNRLFLAMAPTTTPTPMEVPTTTTVREARLTLPPLEDPVNPARSDRGSSGLPWLVVISLQMLACG
jgi:hypothetical protein